MIRNYFRVINITIEKVIIGSTQPAHGNPETSLEGPLKVLTSGTYRGPSEDSQGANTKIDIKNFKKLFCSSNSPWITYLLFFLQEEKMCKRSKWGRHRTSMGPSCKTSLGPNDGRFQGRPWEVGQTCFLNSTHKHKKLTLTSYSRLYSEWQQ